MRKDVALYNERILRSNLKNRNRGKNKVTVEACLKDANDHNDNPSGLLLKLDVIDELLHS